MIEIFISYSDTDKDKVRILEKIINENDKYLRPIIVADKRKALSTLSQLVHDGIFACEYFIPIMSKLSMNAQWLNQEIGFAYSLQRKIFPIIEEGIIKNLKGFINSETQLPYIFATKGNNSRSKNLQFKKTAKLLIDDILLENDISPKKLSIENLFQGRWKLNYSGPYNGSEEVEIKDGKYYAKPENSNQFRHCFDLKSVLIDMQKKEIKYAKIGINPDTRIIQGTLKIVETGKYYTGFETNQRENDTVVSYFKLSD